MRIPRHPGQPFAQFSVAWLGLASQPKSRQTNHTRHLEAPNIDLEPIPIFFEADAVKAMAALETRITGCLTLLDSTEEGLKSLVAVYSYHLQDMAVNVLRLGKGLFILLHIGYRRYL